MNNLQTPPYLRDLSDESLLSKTISFLRFPLIALVVFIHTRQSDLYIEGTKVFELSEFPIFAKFEMIFAEIIPYIAVPLFFFISGFLFFKGEFTKQTYLSKLKRRVHSLLIPYILWNIIIFLFYYLTGRFDIGDNLFDCLYKIFWSYLYGCPICYQFWFIRDLMVAMILSPIFYWLIKYTKGWIVLLFGLLWFYDNNEDVFLGLSYRVLFFFSLGAFFKIFSHNFVKESLRAIKWILPLYVILFIITILLANSEFFKYSLSATTLLGMVVAVALPAKFISLGKWHVNKFLTESSFFVYGYHAAALPVLFKIMFTLIKSPSEISLTFMLFFDPTVVILVGLGIYWLLRRYLPRLTAVLTGGR